MEDRVVQSDADQAQPTAGGSGEGGGGRDGSNAQKKAISNPTVRKRTKTGCLTCRKRRIKCDEGRPTCNNCIKSKRICEGYNQRVIFKDPIGAHPFPGAFGPFGYIPGPANHLGQMSAQQGRPPGQGLLPTIAPKPPAYDYHLQQQQQQPHQFQYGYPYTYGQPSSAPQLPCDFNANLYPQASVYTPQLNPQAASFSMTTYNQFSQPTPPQPPPPPGPSHLQYYPSHEVAAAAHPSSGSSGNFHIEDQTSPALPVVQPPQDEIYESSDEDASMAASDDEEVNSKALMTRVLSGLRGQSARDVSLRSFSSYARSDMLSEYMSSPHASELKDGAKRKLFEHFMRVTGPSMSLYERHPFDPAEKEVSGTLGGGSNIWSYTFPLMAFQHPALLQAILALASLQVSRLQNTPPTAAHKHYHMALRRVAKNVRTQLRRLQPATLAATLLLGYFEVWNSEHLKWCSHLYGARTLFAETPLRAMSRKCLPAKSLRERQKIMKKMGFAGIGGPLPGDHNPLDFDLITTITGYRVVASDYGLSEDQVFQNAHSATTEKDIDRYENLRDLFWWYCKMDVYQTILGGTKLFMDYEHWTQCPPRAPASKLDSIYGTYDHLMLLLGRLAYFASNDLTRKRQVSRARGPPPGGASPPSFPGMLPTQGNVRPPMGFTPPRSTAPHSDSGEGIDLEASSQAALQEWESIRHAFEVFENYLGPEFQPLSPELADHRDYPFGPALQYRTFSVAGIWMNYYMGVIHLYRSHPSMPPAAMQSVGFSAHQTALAANRIGRICVGLSDDLSGVSEISTVMAAAFIESSFCLFVAAVQYQNDDERKWVVRQMHNVTRLTGWQSAKQIANGCESAWAKAAKLGRGPPYERAPDLDADEQSVWDSARRIDKRIQEVDGGREERRVVLARAERAHYALGLLSIEDDLEYLELKDDAFNPGTEAGC